MRTTKQVIADNPDLEVIIEAVVSEIGYESISDVNNHGINVGFSGFIYYDDTHNFAMKHRDAIIKMLENDADAFGEDIVIMICNFGFFRNNPADKVDKKEIYRYLSGYNCEQSTITNLMAWYAAETVCRLFE